MQSSCRVVRRAAKSCHSSTAKPLPLTVIEQPMRVKVHLQQAHGNWKHGVIVDSVAPHSYIVKVDGRKCHRNLVHLRDTIQSSQSQPNAHETSCNETADPSTNRNATQDDSSDTPPLPAQNSRMTRSVDPVIQPTRRPATRTWSEPVVKQNTLPKDIVQ